MEIKVIKLKDLHTNTGQIQDVPKNPRFLRDEKFEKLKKSIQDDPEMLELRELLVYDNFGKYVVIGGNMRFKALQSLGYTDTVCKILPKETTPEKLRAYIIKDNVPFGENDMDLLANEWDIEELTDWGMDLKFLDNDNDIDFDNIESNEDRETKDKTKEVICPNCSNVIKV